VRFSCNIVLRLLSGIMLEIDIQPVNERSGGRLSFVTCLLAACKTQL
jgi:hypothetical protein